MKRSIKIAAVVLVVSIAVLGIGTAIAKGGPGGYGPGAFCNKQSGMMMQRGQGLMGRSANRELNLSEKQVKTLVEARLIRRGNDRLKIGKIAKKDDQTYLVDIVTVDDSLVRQVEIDKDSGFPARRRPGQQ